MLYEACLLYFFQIRVLDLIGQIVGYSCVYIIERVQRIEVTIAAKE